MSYFATYQNEHAAINCRESIQWMAEQLPFSRYAGIPLGNLTGDYPLLIADVFFARALKRENHLLWNSASAMPDLGVCVLHKEPYIP